MSVTKSSLLKKARFSGLIEISMKIRVANDSCVTLDKFRFTMNSRSTTKLYEQQKKKMSLNSGLSNFVKQ